MVRGMTLADQLRRRRDIIADHAWRDRDAAGHLDALKEVSVAIETSAAALPRPVEQRLSHFLKQCSYDKALAFLEETGQ